MKHLVVLLFLLVVLAACTGKLSGVSPLFGAPPEAPVVIVFSSPTPTATTSPSALRGSVDGAVRQHPGAAALATRPSPSPTATRTPAPSPTPLVSPTPVEVKTETVYIVQDGDTLEAIAGRYGMAVADLMAINQLSSANLIGVGQQLNILAPQPLEVAPAASILIPDSELVYSPAYRDFDTKGEIKRFDGYLARHVEEAEGQVLTGPQIVDRVARRYSVGPRVLLALLEIHSGWVTKADPVEMHYPLGQRDPGREGLFKQLSWAANRLNEGYYTALHGNAPLIYLKDGTPVHSSTVLNPGSVAVVGVLAQMQSPQQWQWAVGEGAFVRLYTRLFGDPLAYEVTPLLPAELTQPPLALPWADEETWFFTGGPHGGWGEGSSRAGLDFAPPTKNGCVAAPEWVLAVADGVIIRSENGEVVQDLDGDGFLGTGWTILYMHMAEHDRVPEGTWVRAGDRIGHPSCVGGWSEATHLHIARRYNGQWMQADRAPLFEMEGWQPIGWARSYDGELVRGSHRLQACSCRAGPQNAILGK